MRIFASFNEAGLPVGFYPEALFPEPPMNCVEISAAQHTEFLAHQGRRRWANDDVVAYEPPPPATTVDMIKAEARRRILAIMTEDQQRNTLAAGQAAAMQYGADPASWPEELQARQVAAMEAWSEIERLRARSNEIETMDPLPADVTADELWMEPAAE